MRNWVVFVTSQSMLFLMLIGTLLLVSIVFVKDLNVEAFPDSSPPIVEVTSVYEGRSAEELERLITIPLEVAFAGMNGLDRINSISLYGLSDVKCKFNYGISYLQARQEVINRLAMVDLPGGVNPRIVANPIGEIMRYTLVGSDNVLELRTIQDWVVSKHLRTSLGIEDVPSYGGFVKMYNVIVQPENLLKYGITLNQVIESLSKANLNVGGRFIEKGDQYYMVRGLGLISSLADIENAIVTTKGGKPIIVKNIATVAISNIPRTGIVGFNEKDDVVMGTVVLRKDAKSIPAIKSVHEKIEELNSRILPKGIKLVPYYERWDLVKTVIVKVIETAASGIALVAAALFLFLGNVRAAIITAAIIPISLLITLALMVIKGESANLLSIGAIDFGIIADIPLLLMEDYFRQTQKHGTGAISIARAADEIGKPMLFSVAIIMLAFIPIFMMKGAEAQIFAPMAKTYLYAIACTVMLTFSYLIAAQYRLLQHSEDREFSFLEKLRLKYIELVKQLLAKRRQVLMATFGVVIISLLIGMKFISTQFLPKMDEGNIYARIVFPYTISLNKTYEHAKKVKRVFLSFDEVKSADFKIGRPEDGTDPNGPFNSDYNVQLKPYSDWKRNITKQELEQEVRTKLKQMYPNADINISQYIQDNLEEMMSGVKGENAVKIFGDDLVHLDRISREVKDALSKVPGIADEGVMRSLGQPNLIIEVHREVASALGLTVQDVLDAVSAALGGREVSEIIEGAKRFSLQVSFPLEYRREPEKIPNIPIVLPSGGVVALSRIANIHYDTGASFIYRENYRKYIPVKFSVTSNDLGGTVAQAQELTKDIKMPEGYYMVWSGMFNEMKKSFQRFMVSIPIAFFMILATLYIMYRSVRNVLITMSAPLFSVFAGLLALLLTGESLSVSSMVGFISIIGVSILNASVIVSHYIRLIIEGTDRHKAILETVNDKFRPVLMGGFVAALGLLPASMAHGIGSQVQRPLAIVVVGGMLVGITLILLITPLLLEFVEVDDRE